MLALPGAAYVYQGEELGLPEVVDLPDEVLTDPIFHRTGAGARPRRLPGAAALVGARLPFGFTSGRRRASPGCRSRSGSPTTPRTGRWPTRSFWHLYRETLALRRRLPALAANEFRWLSTEPGVLAFTRGDGFVCVVNCSSRVVSPPLDGGDLLIASHQEAGDKVPPNSAAWYLLAPSAESVGRAA